MHAASALPRLAALTVLLSCGGSVSTSTSPPPDASAFASSDALVIDATNLYWIDSNASAVMKAPRAGGPAEALATTSATSAGYGIKVDATNVFWIDPSRSITIQRVPIAGGPSAMVATGEGGPIDVAVDGEHIYFARQRTPPQQGGELVEMTLGTGVTRTVANAWALGLALDGDQIFGTSCTAGAPGDGVWRVSKAGGAPVALVHDAYCPITIAIRGNYVYYADAPNATVGTAAWALWRVPRDGGTKEMLAPIDGTVFAVDATNAYAFQSRALIRIPLDKSPSAKLTDVNSGRGIAVDDARVYWTYLGASAATVVGSMPK